DRGGEGVQHAAQRRALLADVGEEDLADRAVLVLAGGDVALVAADRELVGDRFALARHLAPLGFRRLLRALGLDILALLRVGAQRLRRLRAVAVDRQRLRPASPAAGVGVGDVGDGRRLRQVDR